MQQCGTCHSSATDILAIASDVLSEARFAVVTTGGYSIEGVQEPFVPFPGFDDKVPGIREIPLDVEQSKLRIDHPGYDHRFAEEDVNVNLPVDRIAELAKGGESNVPRWIIALNGNKLWDVREIEALWSWHKLLSSKSYTNHVKTLTARKKVNSRKT